MDTPRHDEASTPEWRPVSSLSSGLPSTASSSMLLPRPPSTISHVDFQTISSGSRFSVHAAAFDKDTTGRGNSISPFEPIACMLLTEEVRSFISNAHGLDPVHERPPAFRADSLEAAIQHAAATISYNAKWFAPAALAELLNVVLEAAGASSSSAVLYAALRFLDTVLTFTVLPPHGCVLPAVRFIAHTYYSASRAHKTKKLVETAWIVAVHMLHSHLGHQLLGALYTIIGSGDHMDSREGLAQTTGAVMLMKERLRCPESDIPEVSVTMLVIQLRGAALASNSVLQEHIIDIISDLISDKQHMQQLHLDAQWANILEIIAHCISESSNHDAAQLLVNSLATHLSAMGPEHVATVAWLFIKLGLPLSEPLSTGLLAPWTALLPNDMWASRFDDMLSALSANTLYERELKTLIDHSTVVCLESASRSEAAILVPTLERRILSTSTTPQAATMMSSAIIGLFRHGITTDIEATELNYLFDALCAVSRLSTEAVQLLFRIRKDVTGALYLNSASRCGELGFTEILRPLPMDVWFGMLCDIFEKGAGSWDVFEYILHNTKSLLGNHALFIDRLHIVRVLLKVVTSCLETDSYMSPPPYTGLTKSYVAAHLVQTLTAIMSYHRWLSKQEILGLVSTFDRTAGSRDYIVSIQSINALTICCYEVPDVMSSHMDGVINKMSRMVTQKYLAIHVLHFLAGLSRLPDLYRNFKQQDYMRIFGVCHSYLQSARGTQSMAERKQTPTSDRSSITRNEEALPEYVYALAHHVITFWYMSLREQERGALKEYITRCLVYKGADGKDLIEDQGLVTIDMMDRIDSEPESSKWYFGDVESKTNGVADMPRPFTSTDGQLTELHRLVGLLLLTTQTSLRTGRTLVTIRRPSGTALRTIEKGRAHVTVDGDETDFLTVMPSDTEGATYGTITIPKPSSALEATSIITLPQDDAVRRAIEAFDRTSALDSHKTGVIYIGERQTTEDRVLQNVSGSPDYRELLTDLGGLHALKGATFNTQGLDRSDNADGEFAIVWHNQVTEVVFHVTTMMPNSEDARENTAKKKRHIGNDHVNIIFNNSGGQLDFAALYSMFPGQLTYVYIVITPSARTSFVEARTENVTLDKSERFYGVQVVASPDYPNVSPAAEEKVVSGASLPGFVRNLVLNDCIISLMWTPRNDSSEYPSSWRSRLHQLRRLGERYGGKRA